MEGYGDYFYNDKDVNLEMIINGHAWVYRKYLRTIPKNIEIYIIMLKRGKK